MYFYEHDIFLNIVFIWDALKKTVFLDNVFTQRKKNDIKVLHYSTMCYFQIINRKIIIKIQCLNTANKWLNSFFLKTITWIHFIANNALSVLHAFILNFQNYIKHYSLKCCLAILFFINSKYEIYLNSFLILASNFW